VPYQPSTSPADAFNQGLFHPVNNQHANAGSITLGDEASSADQGLDASSDRWNSNVANVATSARSVLAPFSFSRAASPNGTASQNYIQGLGSLGSANGESQQTFDGNLRLRQQGDDSAEID